MILYYTGTGNSRHLARILAEKLEDELVSAAELIREGRTGDFRSEKPWVFVCPTCKQKLRVPRGKGKISITCPKCATSFIKKT